MLKRFPGYPNNGFLIVRISTVFLFLFFLVRCQSIERSCDDPVSILPRDTTVTAYDTAILRVEHFDNCSHPDKFTWSFDGGLSFDTTATPTITHVFTHLELGQNTIEVRALAPNGHSSLTQSFRVYVEEKPFNYQLPQDTLFAFADTSLEINLNPLSPISGIEWYVLTKTDYPGWTDSSHTPLFRVKVPSILAGTFSFSAQVILASGERSEKTMLIATYRPQIFGGVNSIASTNLFVPNQLVRILLYYPNELGIINPRNNQIIKNLRALDLDKNGKVVQNQYLESSSDLAIQKTEVNKFGDALLLGIDESEPYPPSLYAAMVGRNATFAWEKLLRPDTGYIQPIQIFANENGDFSALFIVNQLLVSGSGVSSRVNRIRQLDFSVDGAIKANRILPIDDFSEMNCQAIHLRDGRIVVAGGMRDSSDTTRSNLLVAAIDSNATVSWKNIFRSQLGNPSVKSMNTLLDGSLLITGIDYGESLSNWILKLGSDGSELEFHVMAFPTGYTSSIDVITEEGKVLSLLNADEESVILLSDHTTHEIWRHSFKESYQRTVLEQATPISGGGFLVRGSITPSTGGYHQSSTFLFKLDQAGNIVW